MVGGGGVCQFDIDVLSETGPYRSADAQGLDAGHFVPQIQVNSMTAARLIARESNALVPGSVAIRAEDVAAGRLVRLDVDAPALRTDPGVFYLRGRSLAPAARCGETSTRLPSSSKVARTPRALGPSSIAFAR